MTTVANGRVSETGEYVCLADLDLFDSPKCDRLATQAGKGRQLSFITSVDSITATSVQVRLSEDSYEAWLPTVQLSLLQSVTQIYQARKVTREVIAPKLSDIIAFTQKAMAIPNVYLWGGNLGPNYDCSGLMQAAFLASGIWLPRDSYQQAAFTQTLSKSELEPGDLIFFGKPKVDHVALYLGEGHYIHSSGTDKGRNGIAVDSLTEPIDAIARGYETEVCSFGRVMASFDPVGDHACLQGAT